MRRNKYNAKPVTADGHTFQSTAEFARYCELKILERAGEISGLVVHPRYPLMIGAFLVGHYTPDFVYYERGRELPTVSDVKGLSTEAARLRIKVFEAIYRTRVLIVKKRKWQLRDVKKSSTTEEQPGGASRR